MSGGSQRSTLGDTRHLDVRLGALVGTNRVVSQTHSEMNILFRKNFQSDANKGGYGASRARGKRTGDYGYSAMDEHHSSYRTHIFLNPSNLPQEYEDEVTKRTSFTSMNWSTPGTTRRKPSGGRSDYPFGQLDTPTRQVRASPSVSWRSHGNALTTERTAFEPITYSTIDQLSAFFL